MKRKLRLLAIQKLNACTPTRDMGYSETGLIYLLKPPTVWLVYIIY